MNRLEALITALVILGTIIFCIVWLAVMQDAPTIVEPVVKPPCTQLSEFRMRKTYPADVIANLCEHQPYDERFHGESVPHNPKRIKPQE